MIKKQLGLLAGSVMLASTASAAITLGGDTIAVFNTAGAGSYYQLVSGSDGDSLAGGAGFSIDISAAQAALGGTIDSFTILAVAGGTDVYNYSEFLYASDGGGLVFAADTATSTTNSAANNKIFNIEGFLANADVGLNGEGSLGDFDGNANVADLLASGVSSVVLNTQTLGGLTDAVILGAAPGFTSQIDGLNFEVAAVPVPAAAWLFGSALLGLGVVRRKR